MLDSTGKAFYPSVRTCSGYATSHRKQNDKLQTDNRQTPENPKTDTITSTARNIAY